jgi:DNA-binding transcriptional MerR regulator
MKIGDVATTVGTTTRTIRYYEEIGLLPGAEDRPSGRHRAYTDADVDRLREVLRLKDVLGVSLDELRELVAAEDARAELREEFRRTEDPAGRERLLREALGHLERQLELVRARRAEIDALERDLVERFERVSRRLDEVHEEVGT